MSEWAAMRLNGIDGVVVVRMSIMVMDGDLVVVGDDDGYHRRSGFEEEAAWGGCAGCSEKTWTPLGML
eukprot:4451218-Pyramimonas_sp.AAC.1